MDNEGKIYRDGAVVVVERRNAEYLLQETGVTCLNPHEPLADRIYQKRFAKKKIYLPDEYHRAKADYLSHPDSCIISMNGYSSIGTEQLLRYGIKDGAYEEACAALLRRTLKHLKSKFPGAHLVVTNGASNMGVDRAILAVMHERNEVSLGFSCPRFMFYVSDDEKPVYVAATQDEYADMFIVSLDILIATGGREQALKHDVSAACIHGKRIHFVDILSQLSPSGSVPATVTDANGKIKVENAAAAFGRNISFFGQNDTSAAGRSSGDIWDDIFTNVCNTAAAVCRSKMSPERMFEGE